MREAQRALRDLGYRPGPIDGMFGPQMRMALEKYQLSEKLPVTGQLDAYVDMGWLVLHEIPELPCGIVWSTKHSSCHARDPR